MTFEHDLLISYAHIDDQTLVDGEEGWVSRLHHLLEVRVGQLLGSTPKIWRDQKLQGNDYFADTILERLPRIAALVSIFSPRYVQSEWCTRELREFCLAANRTGGVRVADKARVFKVVKTPISLDRFPEEVQRMLGYEFFIYDDAGRARELAQVKAQGSDRAFLAKLDDLAQDIVKLLEMIGRDEVVVEQKERKGAVFLAETSFDLRDDREAVRRDLIRNGYEVLPDRPLPQIATELDAAVREHLLRSKLSIHLVGRNYGIVAEGATQSTVERQQTLASQLAPVAGFSSVIWLPPGVEIEDKRQRQFVDRLQTDPAVHAAAELLEVPFEDLKTIVYGKLAPPPVPMVTTPAMSHGELTRIYLLCDQQDVEATRPIEDFLFDRGFEVMLPVFDEDETQARLEHEEILKSADALLLYYGAASDLWLRRKLRELQKSAGLGREKPWLGRAIYIGAPATPQKERFRTLEATTLHEAPGGFTPSALDPFLAEIAKARGAA
ncbi:MAG TPA: toll/interleukin-1 receptor domain-containing protein [Thermoanaerobaculia bacterium]